MQFEEVLLKYQTNVVKVDNRIIGQKEHCHDYLLFNKKSVYSLNFLYTFFSTSIYLSLLGHGRQNAYVY